MLDVPYLPPALPDGDKSGRFIATGVILLLVALMSGCATAMVPTVFFTAQRKYQQSQHLPATLTPPASATPAVRQAFAAYRPPPRPEIRPVVVASAMYLTVTVGAMWLGVAALLKRRYVRPLVLIFGTHAILFGALTVMMFGLFMPLFVEQIQRTSQTPVALAYMGLSISIAFLTLFLIGLPVALVLLMKPDAVRQTAEHFDLRARWTDAVPLKLLGLVVTLAVLALAELTVVNQPGLPMVFTTLSGPTFVFLILAHAALMATAAVLVYQRRMIGWTLAFYGLIVPSLLYSLSTVTLPSKAYLSLVKHQPEAADLMRDHETLFRVAWAATSIAFLVATVIYLLRMRPLVEPPVATAVSE